MNDILTKYGVEKPGNYYLLIARMEPENNIETISGWIGAKWNDSKKILVIGNVENRFGQKMKAKFARSPACCFRRNRL
jgi:hypothetical protein